MSYSRKMDSASIQSVQGSIPFNIPGHCQVLTHAVFNDRPAIGTAEELVAKALKTPVNAQPIAEQLGLDNTVVIIVEDLTRSSPKKAILAALLEELSAVGIPPENICIVIALGTHQALSKQELETGFGSEITKCYRVINHDCHAPDLVAIGKLQTGGVVKINRHVHEADFRIGIGSIFPHPMNGFGGGGKILFPGVADFESIFEHHLKLSFAGQARLGLTDGNDFYQEVSRLAQAGRLDFIINSVLDHNDRLYDVVCGEPIKAHAVGIQICKQITSKMFTAPADITIISAFPYSKGPQIMKPLAPAELITRKGGSVILYADCTVPLPEIYFAACEKFRAQYGNGLRQAVLYHFAHKRPILDHGSPELNMSLAQALIALNDYQVILVTDGVSQRNIKRLGFTAAKNLDDAVAACAKKYDQPTVNIVPSGGVIVPILSDP